MKRIRGRLISVAAVCVTFLASVGLGQDESVAQPDVTESDAAIRAEITSPLRSLDWMVGTWIDAADETTIVTSCSWTKNQRFLKRSFQVKIDEEVTLEGDQFVGWDPIANQIRSWTFDSEGGIGEGIWIEDGDKWLVKKSFVLADGSRASSVNVYTYVDEDTFRWRSANREVAGEFQPSIGEVIVIRQQSSQTNEPEAAQ